MHKKLFFTFLGLAILAQAASAADNYIMDTSSIGKSHNGVVSSDQILELGEASSNALFMEGESALRDGNVDRAITIMQRAVETAPLDIDKRILYAQALEQKLISQTDRDPSLFNFCVKQWLFVAKKSEFADQAYQGYSHLQNLTGIAPHKYENERKYLAKVLLPVDGSAKVALGKRRTATNLADKDKDKDKNE